MRRRGFPSLLVLIYFGIGVAVAAERHYFQHVHGAHGVVAAILAILLLSTPARAQQGPDLETRSAARKAATESLRTLSLRSRGRSAGTLIRAPCSSRYLAS